jgi:hypothetical protein
LFNKNIPIDVVEFLSSERSERFYLQPVGLLGYSENPNPSPDSTNNYASIHTTRAKNDWGITISKEAKNFLRAWLSLEFPFFCQGELYKIVGIDSGSKGARIKRELIALDTFSEAKLPFGRTSEIIWIPKEKAYDIIGLEKPKYHSKGGYLHQYVAYHLTQMAKKSGYLAELEFNLTNGKAVDMLLRKGNKAFFVEIAISEPADKELNNIHKDFASDLMPNLLILAAKDSKMKAEIKRLVAEDPQCKPFEGKIQVVLAGDLIKKGIPELFENPKQKLNNLTQGGSLIEK